MNDLLSASGVILIIEHRFDGAGMRPSITLPRFYTLQWDLRAPPSLDSTGSSRVHCDRARAMPS